jgi:hypothetical protein
MDHPNENILHVYSELHPLKSSGRPRPFNHFVYRPPCNERTCATWLFPSNVIIPG